MSKGLLNIASLIYLTLVVTLTFSINEVSVFSEQSKREKVIQALKNTLRRSGKLIGGLILIGIIIEVLTNLS